VDRLDGTEFIQIVYLLLFASEIKKIGKVLAEGGIHIERHIIDLQLVTIQLSVNTPKSTPTESPRRQNRLPSQHPDYLRQNQPSRVDESQNAILRRCWTGANLLLLLTASEWGDSLI
jgi:hypothetical protein